MYRLIRPGGFALVNVAAMEVLQAATTRCSAARCAATNASGLACPADRAGFTIERITYTNACCSCRWRRARGCSGCAASRPSTSRRPRQKSRSRRRRSTPLLTMLLKLESVWLRWFDAPFGSSLLCLARKPE